MLHSALKARGVKASVVLVSYGWTGTDNVARMLARYDTKDINEAYTRKFKEHTSKGLGATCNAHVAVKVGDTLYDSNGIYKGTAISEGINASVMREFLNMDCWNGAFKRYNNYIGTRKLVKLFDTHFEQLLAEV